MKRLSFVLSASLGLCALLALPPTAPTADDKEPAGKTAKMDKAHDLAAYYAEDGTTLNVFYRNADGAIVELSRPAGEGADKKWQLNDLTAESRAPKAASGPAVYTTKGGVTKGSTHHVVFRGSDNQIHELYRSTEGRWDHRNLSSSTKAPNAVGRPTAFASDDPATVHVVYRTNEGALVDLYRRNDKRDTEWHFNDLMAEAKAPKAAGNPCAYLERAGAAGTTTTHHVIYRGEDGHVHELYVGDRPGKWAHNDLTGEASGPRAAGDPTAYREQKENVQHVFYRSSEGAVIDLYRSRARDADKKWHSNDLTAEAKAPKAAGHPVAYLESTGTVTTSNVQHIVYRNEDGQIHELYLRPKQEKWLHTDVAAAVKAPRAADDPCGFVEKGSIQHIFYRTEDGAVYELYHVGEGTDRGWHSVNLSTAAVRKSS